MQTCSFHHKWQSKHVDSIANVKIKSIQTSGKHVNSITNVKIKSIANIFLCKWMRNVSGFFLHYLLHILNVYYEHFHGKFMYYSMANVKIKSIPNLFVCDHTRNISIFCFFFFFAFVFFFIFEMFAMDIFMLHIDILYPIFMFKKLVFIY